MAAKELIFSSLFQSSPAEQSLSFDESVKRSLARAKAIIRAYDFRIEDILETPSAAFWDMHIDPIFIADSAAATFATIQVNLSAGTLTRYLKKQPYLRETVEKILRFDLLAHYCLTEVGHGLDAVNLETLAVALPDGGFSLHTPTKAAAKMMPPTSPCGIPSVALVFARLQANNKDCGIRPFLVPITDGSRVMPGIKIQLLPMRGGCAPVNHSVTYFNHVKLPHTALLGSMEPLPAVPGAARLNFLAVNWRVATGALALTSTGISAIEKAAYIAGRYSQHRKVGPPEDLNPILNFRTQHTPVLLALAQATVSRQFWKFSVKMFTDAGLDPRTKHAYAAVFKATVINHALNAQLELSERLGARGLFQFTELVTQHNGLRAIAIAEGDILGLCIRLVSELLIGRYQLQPPKDPSSLLARHEIGLFTYFKEKLQTASHHRGDLFNRFILPNCEKMVRAIGHRMAYDAAVEAGVDSRVTDLYLAGAIKQDSAWYVLGANLTPADQEAFEDSAISVALPCIDDWLDATHMEPYAQVPILTPQHWETFLEELPVFQNDEPQTVGDSQLSREAECGLREAVSMIHI